MDDVNQTSNTDQLSIKLNNKHLVAMCSNKIARATFYLVITALIATHFDITFGVKPQITQMASSIIFLSGMFRPIIAWIADRNPIRGSRRKAYAIVGNLGYLGAIMMQFGLDPTTSIGYGVLISSFATYAISEAFLDVSYDSLLLDVAGKNTSYKNKGRSWMRAGAIGGTVLGYGMASLFISTGWIFILLTTLCAVIISSIAVFGIQEPRIARDQILQLIKQAKDQMGRENLIQYKKLLWGLMFFLIVPFMAGAFVDVMMEPFLIDRFDVEPESFYFVELMGGFISLGVIAFLIAFAIHKVNFNDLVIPSLAIAGFYYVALVFLTPNLESYLIWNTMKFTQSMVQALVTERIFMDVVKGQQKGATFQFMAVFIAIGGFAGTYLGAWMAEITTINITFLISAILIVFTIVMYAVYFRARIEQNVKNNDLNDLVVHE